MEIIVTEKEINYLDKNYGKTDRALTVLVRARRMNETIAQVLANFSQRPECEEHMEAFRDAAAYLYRHRKRFRLL